MNDIERGINGEEKKVQSVSSSCFERGKKKIRREQGKHVVNYSRQSSYCFHYIPV